LAPQARGSWCGLLNDRKAGEYFLTGSGKSLQSHVNALPEGSRYQPVPEKRKTYQEFGIYGNSCIGRFNIVYWFNNRVIYEEIEVKEEFG